MISEGSCDTEDWINDAENSDFYETIIYIKLLIIIYIKTENSYFKYNINNAIILFHNITVFTMFLII